MSFLGLGGDEFTSNQYNKQNALNPDDPALAESEARGKYAQSQVGGESVGSWYGDYGLSHGRDAANVSQTPLERLTERRKNYYLGGTPDYAANAAANAENSARYWASKQAALGSDAAHRGDQIFNRTYGPQGPSGAQALLRQGTNEAIGTQLALARSGRGMGQSASAMGAAQGNMVGLQTAATNNAAILKAQEAEAYAQRRDAAQKANDAAALGFAGAGQEAYGAGAQTNLAGLGLSSQITNNALIGNEAYEGNLAQYYGISKGIDAQNKAAEDQKQAAWMQMVGYGFASSDERAKYKLSPIEAKKNRHLGSSGDFDALGANNGTPEWLQQYMQTEGSTGSKSAGVFPNASDSGSTMQPNALAPGQIAPARNFAPLKSYQPPPSSFAQSISANDGDPNRIRPGVTNPWAAGSTRDPWEEYLAKRAAREQAAANQEQSDKDQVRAGHLIGGMGAIGIGLAGLLSDERVKAHARPLGRLAQDPIPNTPAISQRSIIMSDERSKMTIQSLQQENDALKQAIGGAASTAGSGPAVFGRPVVRNGVPPKQTQSKEEKAGSRAADAALGTAGSGPSVFGKVPARNGTPARSSSKHSSVPAILPNIDWAALDEARDDGAPDGPYIDTSPATSGGALEHAANARDFGDYKGEKDWQNLADLTNKADWQRASQDRPIPQRIGERLGLVDKPQYTPVFPTNVLSSKLYGPPGPEPTPPAAGTNVGTYAQPNADWSLYDTGQWSANAPEDSFDKLSSRGSKKNVKSLNSEPKMPEQETPSYFYNNLQWDDPMTQETWDAYHPKMPRPIPPPWHQQNPGSGPGEDEATRAVRAAPGYSYEYKNPNMPGAAPGTHFGPMAQDLERTPAGRSTVVEAPNGMKMVDTGRLALVNTAALHAQQQELDELKRELDRYRGAR